MRASSIPLVALLLVGCSRLHNNDSSGPDLKIGEHYASARGRLIAAGWNPVPAACSPNNLCFGKDYPEMASDMKTGKVCPNFIKGGQKLTVCLEIILDGAKVESFRFGR